jgi:tRNA(fMet)-specific endonuclease VapC
VKYLLDTNVLIQLLRPRHAQPILDRLDRLAEEDAAVCSVVRMELVAGALRSQRPEKNLPLAEELLGDFDSLPLDDSAADQADRLRALLERSGTPIGPNDLLIAGIALSNNLTLITHNTAEFARVPGLRIEDWERPG